MPYLIDGHNLIPKIGLSLQSLDDEQQLIDLLRRFCQMRRQKVEVFFDRAPFGEARARQYGQVKAHFVSSRSSADAAIGKRLAQIGREAANWKVVTSDRQVQAEARSRGAEVISSEEFAQMLREALDLGGAGGEELDESKPIDVDEWLRLFGQGKKGL